MAEAKARITVQVKDEATAQFAQMFGNLNGQMSRTVNVTAEMEAAQSKSSEAAKKQAFNLVDVAAKLYLVKVAADAVVKTLQGLFAFSRLGAEVELTNQSFERVMQSVGMTSGMLQTLSTIANGTISDTKLMQMSNQALVGTTGEFSTAMAQALPQLLEMARASSILNPQLGGVEHQFDRLTLGLKRLSPVIIDDMGIELRLTEVNRNYATQIGKTADELSTEERSFALLNAVLEKHGQFMALAGDMTDVATDPYDRLGAAAENLRDVLAEKLSPEFGIFIGHLADAMDGAREFVSNSEPMIAFLTGLAMGPFKMVNDAFRMFDGYIKAFANNNNLVDFFADVVEVQRNVILGLDNVAHGMDRMRNKTEETSDAIAELDTEFIEKRNKSMDSMFLNMVKINERRIESEERVSERIVEENERAAEKLIDIHEDAERDRTKASRDAAEDRARIELDFAERMAGANKDLADLYGELENKNPFLSPETEGELNSAVEQAETLADALKRLRREQRDDPTDAREIEIAEMEKQQEEMQDRVQEVRDRAREEERRNRILARIEEKQEEIQRLAEQRESELAAVNQKEQEKLAIISANETALTAKTQEESDKRLTKLHAEFAEIAAAADRDIKVATVDAFLAMTEAGSTAHGKLMEIKLAQMGASAELIASFNSTRDSIQSEDGLVGALNRMGLTGGVALDQLDFKARNLNANLGTTISMMNSAIQTSNGLGMSYSPIYTPGLGGRRAAGGSVSAGHPYLVGENGPEIMNPANSGTIMPSVGGGGMTLMVNVNAVAFQGSRADAKRLGDMIGPIVLQYMQSFGGAPNAVGSRNIRSA